MIHKHLQKDNSILSEHSAMDLKLSISTPETKVEIQSIEMLHINSINIIGITWKTTTEGR